MTEPIKLEVGKSYRTRGGERVEITSLDSSKVFPYIADCNGNRLTYMVDGRHCLTRGCEANLIAEWTDEPQEPPIDWGGELQILDPDRPGDEWNDVTVVWHNDEWVVGWNNAEGTGWAQGWLASEWQFRNKPPEPKRVKGWINIYDLQSKNESFRCTMYATKDLADWAADSYRIACVYMDIPYGHGLEGNPDGP